METEQKQRPKRTYFICEIYPKTDGTCDINKYKVDVIDFCLIKFITTLKSMNFEVNIIG